MSVMDTIRNLIVPFNNDQPAPPLHVGEVMGCWTYLATLAESSAFVKTGLNTTTDDELRHVLNECTDMAEAQIKRLKQLMITEGIPLPPVSEPKPDSDPSAVPLGVKLSNDEIANGLALKTSSGITMTATGVTTALRPDLGIIWVECLLEMITFAANLRALMARRGWLKIPPAYIPPGHPIDTQR